MSDHIYNEEILMISNRYQKTVNMNIFISGLLKMLRKIWRLATGAGGLITNVVGKLLVVITTNNLPTTCHLVFAPFLSYNVLQTSIHSLTIISPAACMHICFLDFAQADDTGVWNSVGISCGARRFLGFNNVEHSLNNCGFTIMLNCSHIFFTASMHLAVTG